MLPYQARWVHDQAKVKVSEKSRRIGISWCEAADAAMYAAGERPHGADVWYISYDKEVTREFVQDAGRWSRFYNQAASDMEEIEILEDERKITAYRITYNSRNRITGLTSKPRNLRNKKGRVIIDEAAYVDDLPGMLKSVMAVLMWGGRVRIISTHHGENSDFNNVLKDIRAGKLPYEIHRTDFNDAIADGLCRRVFKVLGKAWTPDAEAEWRQSIIDHYGSNADEELFLIPSKGTGVYLPRTLIESCMEKDIPVLRWEQPDKFAQESDDYRYRKTMEWCTATILPLLNRMPKNHPSYVGEDFGRSGDLTVIMPLQERPGLIHACPFVVELRNIPFEQQKQILFFICDGLPRFRGGAMDARGNGHYLAEVAMQKYGAWRIHQIQLTQSWYIENMPPLKAAFEDKTIILPADPDILDDFRAIKMDNGVAKVPDNHKSRGRDGKQRHGDAGIAGALAVFAVRNCNGGPPDYESVQKRRFAGKGAW